MAKKKLRLGFTGAGFIAREHYKSIQKVSDVDVEVVGVYSRRFATAEKFANEFGIKPYADLGALLDDIDVIDICSPPYAHAEGILEAAKRGVHIMCEKPFIGYSPQGDAADFNGFTAPKEPMYEAIMQDSYRIQQALKSGGSNFCYFENLIYTPHIQKEKEILQKTGAQILRMMGEESTKGTTGVEYNLYWKTCCGGSLMGTGSHPLGTVIYLKKVEGMARNNKPIRIASISAHIHQLTQIPSFINKGFMRSEYYDTEDYAMAHIVFEDGTVADIFGATVVLGGINDYIDIYANNHRTRCNINPTQLMPVYNPGDPSFDNVFVNYGVSNHNGWLNICPDENWMFGYDGEMFDALRCFANGTTPEADLQVALDTGMALHAAYVSAERGGATVSLTPISL
ncbi:Gfo/Idh/MocA family oxidoreductase [Clostridia bacterium OttesenSCG-928-F22]|nr:Gfo/Idh/MocA family oxidoreductase [Clostridia bacterium OttesenSCG-928-F22]